MKTLILLSALILASFPAMVGCQVTRYSRTAADGTKVEVSVKSILKVNSAAKIHYSPVTGELIVDKLSSVPDEKTTKLIIDSGAQAFGTALKAAAGL